MKKIWKLMTKAAFGVAVLSLVAACSKETTDDTSIADASVEARMAGMSGFSPMHQPHAHIALPLFESCDQDSRITEHMDIVVSGDEYPKTYTLTPKADGKRKCDDCTAQIVISISADMKEVGAVQTMVSTFSGKRRSHTGKVTITNLGPKATGTMQYSVEGTEVGDGEHGNMTATISGIATMIAGYDTEDCADDQFVMNGSVSATGDLGDRTTTFTEVLIDKSCEYPTSGVVENTGSKGTVSIDFGDGTCDTSAEVTDADGNTTTIDLSEKPRRRRGPYQGGGQRGGGDCNK